MPCITTRNRQKNKVVVCVRGRTKLQRCSVCGELAEKQCDYRPIKKAKTCDAYLCARCAVSIAHEVDYCPHHPRQMSMLP